MNIEELADILMQKFEFGETEAVLMARYMIEQDENENSTFKFDSKRQIANIKAVTKLQAAMTNF